jgi:predicted small integral membrane protein
VLEWMAWTTPTAIAFALLAATLVGMGIWGRVAEWVPRTGFLGFETDPGLRLYVTLLTVAFFFVVWLAVADLSMWVAVGIAAVIGGVMMRWA